jgi:hypothetical protein
LDEHLIIIFNNYTRVMSISAIGLFLTALPLLICMWVDEQHPLYKRFHLERDLFGDKKGHITLLTFLFLFGHSSYCIWLISRLGSSHDFSTHLFWSLCAQFLIYLFIGILSVRNYLSSKINLLKSKKENKFYLFFACIACVYFFDWAGSIEYRL